MDTTICLKGAILLGDSLNQGYQCQWSPSYYLSSDTVARPLCQPQSTGLHTYYLSISDTSGVIKTDSVKVEVVDCSGIEEEREIQFEVFPNPANEQFWVLFEEAFSGQIELRSITGQALFREELLNETGYELSCKHLSPGIYFLVAQSPDGRRELKRVVFAR
jgi:hypothetical protein